MIIIRFFDLHCDTLYELLTRNLSLRKGFCHISSKRLDIFSQYFGCFAIWIPPEIVGDDAFDFFKKAYQKFLIETKNSENKISKCENFSEKLGKNNAIFTVEGGAVLGGKISNLEYLKKCGIKMMTLTWSNRCEIGDGIAVKNSHGLSKFGKSVVKEMENLNIIVDVSHASEKLFFDVAETAKKPFVASHSNSKIICPHERNLTDEQFDIIRKSGGLVGINFCKKFLSNKDNPDFNDILRHIEKFLELGGEDTISIGSDFDGTDIPACMTGIDSIPDLYEFCLKKGYNETLLDKIFYLNAFNFFKKNT